MENWRRILRGRLFRGSLQRQEAPKPQISEKLQLPGDIPLELSIAHAVPEIEFLLTDKNKDPRPNPKLSLKELVEFFGLQSAIAAKTLPAIKEGAPINFDFTLEETGLRQTALRATRTVEKGRREVSLQQGKTLIVLPENVQASTRAMTVKTAEQAGIYSHEAIGDENAEIIILARWANPGMLPNIGIAYKELYLHIDRKVLYSTTRYGTVWEVFIGLGTIYISISPLEQRVSDQKSFRLDFEGRLLR